jgi:hypothetical protein
MINLSLPRSVNPGAGEFFRNSETAAGEQKESGGRAGVAAFAGE